MAPIASSHPAPRANPPLSATGALPADGGSGAGGEAAGGGVTVGVAVDGGGLAAGAGVPDSGVADAGGRTGAGDGVTVGGATVGGEAVGGASVGWIQIGVGVAVADSYGGVGVAGGAVLPRAGVTVAVEVAGGGETSFVTVAVQRTSEPPPFAEPLHWSTFTTRVEVAVDPSVTRQINPTLVPPFPESLHWPTVAALTEVTPGVFAGLQIAGAPGPVIADPAH